MSTNADQAKATIDSQAAKGRDHYGVGLEDSTLSVSGLAQYGAEEAADLLAYMVELRRRAELMEADNANLRAALAPFAAAAGRFPVNPNATREARNLGTIIWSATDNTGAVPIDYVITVVDLRRAAAAI